MAANNINRSTVEAELDEIIQVASQYGNNNQDNNNSKASPPSMAGTTAPTSEDDNMDFDSDDDDDSKSNHSSSNRSGGRRKFRHEKGDVKRSHHNVLERKRRDLIKDSFSKLREVVPTLSNERASRAQILKKAADFIQLTNQKNESTRSSIEELVRKNLELERKLSAAAQQNTVKQEPTTSTS